MAALLNRPAFGPYMQLLGANRAYEPAALAVIAFGITWACLGVIQLLSRFQKRPPARSEDFVHELSHPSPISRNPTARRKSSSTSTWRSKRANSSPSSARPAAARRRPCAWSRLRDAFFRRDQDRRRPAERSEAQPTQYRHGLPAYALFPNMTAADNVGFGLKVRGVNRADRDKTVPTC